MGRRLTIIVVVVALFVGFGGWWRAQRQAERAEMDAGLAASRTLSAVFARTSVLQVAELTGDAVTRVEGRSGFGVFSNVQTTRAPYAVNYTVDLRRLSRRDFRWDADTRTMTVTIPEVVASPPRVDLAQARSEQHGIFVSRASGLAMGRRVAANLTSAASAKANEPAQLARAQGAARQAVAALVGAPLTAAGLEGVTVRVRLAGEDHAGTEERWDVSRSVEDVIRN